MAGSGWENFGDEIRRTVQDAVENQDFHRLNQNITDTVDRAMGAAFHSVSNGMKNARTSQYRQAAAAAEQGRPAAYRRDTVARQAVKLPALYKKPSGNMAKGILFGIVGGWLGIPFGLYTIGGILAALLGGFQPEYLAVSIPCGVLSAGGLGLMKYGIGLCGMQNRFKRLVQGIGNREYCDVKELAAMTGRTEAKTIKDLQRMSLKGWFLQPHFDESRKCFITSDRMYQEYMRLNGQRKEVAARLEAERNEEVKREEDMCSRLSPEARKVIEAGDSFIKRIRACNDAIAGQEISAKISHMEMLVDGIFDRVEQNPESIADVRKLMDYYLPTTIKLLEAYRDLDSQPIEGENIRASKQEIEATLDTLNHAFEKILDDLFHRTAWDVSSDISVLNTMLAREGLTDDGIKLS
ncbi:MAG: hypothetical protein HFH10_08020 [Dorea sp.]|nr:hypothetical protein [Dorea sp.]